VIHNLKLCVQVQAEFLDLAHLFVREKEGEVWQEVAGQLLQLQCGRKEKQHVVT
jgi:hypothetical protein